MKRVLEQKPHILVYTAEQPKKKQQNSDKKLKGKKQVSKGLKGAKQDLTPTVQDQEVAIEAEDDLSTEYEVVKDKEDEDEFDKEEEEDKPVVSRPVVENPKAVIIGHDDKMDTKRDKFAALIDLENAEGSSAQAKQMLLSKSQHLQFAEDIARWDDADTVTKVEEKERQKALKKTKTKRKRLDMYDQEYDRGKIKKVKQKTDDKFNKPNMFQVAAEEMRRK